MLSLVGFALAAAPVQTDAAARSDAICVIAMAQKGEALADNPEGQAAIAVVTFFYVGKLVGRMSAERVRALVNAVEREADPAEIEAAGAGCAAAMGTIGEILQKE